MSSDMDPMAPGDVEQRRQSEFFTINRSAMQQYKISLDRLDNTSSNLILEEIWEEHSNIMDDQSVNGADNLAGPISLLIPNKHMVRDSASWKSEFRSLFDDPDFINSLEGTDCPNADTCGKQIDGLDIFMQNQHTTDPSLFEAKDSQLSNKQGLAQNELSNNQKQLNVLEYNENNNAFTNLVKGVKPRNVISKETKNTQMFNENMRSNKLGPCKPDNTGDDICIPQPVKSVFKTARDQLISSNPATKRSLGTARKPQSKFVSPMMMESKEDAEQEEVGDDRLKHIDPKMVELIESEIIDKGAPIAWEDIAGLKTAKSVIQEAVVWPLLRPDIFTGLRRPPKGVLLFGPPGTGKTLIGKCVASQCRATFFNISASSLTSKWIGDGEKMVRALFAVAKCHQPAVIFIDEIDSLLTQRSDAEHEATRRIKTEFLVQFDGAGTGDEDRILIIGATNRPQELDEAARRRLVKRLYIPLPDFDARKQIVERLMRSERHELRGVDVDDVCRLSEGYSGADMRSLCAEAAMGPIRSVPLSQIVNIQTDQVRAVCIEDFQNALQRVRPSVSSDDLAHYIKWDTAYGLGC